MLDGQDDDVATTLRPLLGRDSELAALSSALDDAMAGHPQAILLAGDAGVGKTRLLTEVMGLAQERGMTRLIGHCIDFGDVGLPYLPFTEAFGRLATDRPDVVEDLQNEFAPIARLLPQRRLLAASHPSEESRVDWSVLYAAVIGALSRLGELSPVVLVVEDAHWADQSTRELLGFLLTRLDTERVALMVSYRSDDLHRRHPLRGSLAEWSRLPRARRLQLPPLDDASVRALIKSLSRDDLADSDVQCIVDRAEGNAFFAEELVSANDDGAAMNGFASVPARLSDLLIVRLDRVSDAARQVIRFAAVAGRRIPHQMLEAVADLPHTALDAAVREAVDANILQRRADDYYGFRHALLGDAVYDDLLPGERVRMHAAFASALAKESVSGTAAELARHARESHDLDTAFAASIRAGDEAFEVAAPQEAMRHYETALELVDRVSPAVAVDRCELMLNTAAAAFDAGHQLRSLAFAKQALSSLADTSKGTDRARVLLAIGNYAATVEAEAEGLAASTEALKLVPAEPPSQLRAEVVSLHARTCSQLSRDDEALRWAREAVATWDAIGKPELSTDARTTLAVLEKRVGDPDEAARQFEQIAAQARGSGQIGDELRSLFQLGMLSFSRGQLDEAVRNYTRGWQRARQTGRTWAFYGSDARVHLAVVQYVRGEWDEALALTDTSNEHAPPFSGAQLVCAGLAVRAGRGDETVINELPAMRPRFKQDGMLAVLCLPQVVEVYTQRGQTSRALAAAEELIVTLTDLWQQPWFQARIRLSALCLAALAKTVASGSESERAAAVQQGAQFAADGRRALEEGAMAKGRPGPESLAWRARVEAEWARLRWLADSDPVPAAEHIQLWRDSVEAFAGQPYERARSQARLAAVLKAVGRVAEASDLSAEATAVAQRLKAAPLLAELAELGLARPPASPAAGAGSPNPLTAREVEVLSYLVQGKTNRQIARQLYISEKTVSVHVSNLLAKMGVRSRAEAAARARRT